MDDSPARPAGRPTPTANRARRTTPAANPADAAGPASGIHPRLGRLAARFDLRPGEVTELLERLPFGERHGHDLPEVWARPIARRALERYAARKRAVVRLARYGSL